jgi:hypothetical protein
MMPPHLHVLGGTMRSRTAAAAVAVLALALTACSSSDEPTVPSSSPAVSSSPSMDRAAARQQCVDEWVTVLEATDDPDVADEPAVCDQVPGQSAAMYAEALRESNAANRKPLDDCLADDSCTELPIPQ